MLDPVLLASIHDLEFVARVTVEGALSGLHRSPFHGYSAEFSQYRHYRAGDDLKYIDWKLFARTDRLYTKQFRETTNVRMQVVLDASASMSFRGRTGAAKIGYGRVIAGALAHLLVQQGDAAGLTVYDADVRTYLGSRPGKSHLRTILTTLSRTSAAGGTASAMALRRAIDLLRNRGVVVLISDLYEDEENVHAELRRAARMGHDVTVFHVLTHDELECPWSGEVEAEDSETGSRVLTSAAGAAVYRDRIQAFVQRWRQRCTTDGIAYVLTSTDAPPDQTLRRYLLRRVTEGLG
jgi:uncharacterized protein (DUF58 family)